MKYMNKINQTVRLVREIYAELSDLDTNLKKGIVTINEERYEAILNKCAKAINAITAIKEITISEQVKNLTKQFKKDGCFPSPRNTMYQVAQLAKAFNVEPEAMARVIIEFAEANGKGKDN